MAVKHIRLWTGFGTFLSVAVAGSPAAATAFEDADAPMMLAQGGEGGEGERPSSYKLLSNDPQAYAFDVRPQVENYVKLVQSSYAASAAGAEKLRVAIRTMLDKPTAETLAAARVAWIEARPAYLVTEVFRFYDGPIDVRPNGETGPEIVTSRSSGALWNVITSGRCEAKRWSPVM